LLFLSAVSLGSCVANVESGPPNQGVIAYFNPAASPPQVPTPTDLILVGGSLQVPVDPAEATTPALKALNDYLRTLDGYPPDTAVDADFSGALDPKTLAEGVYVLDLNAGKLLPATAAPPALIAGTAGANARLTIDNVQRWQNGHTYEVAVLSWQDASGVHGVRSAAGQPVLADQAFPFVRSAQPIVGTCANIGSAACMCSSLADPNCHAVVDGLTDAQAIQLEAARNSLSAGLDAILKPISGTRQQVVLAFSFTISSRPFAVFDPTRGNIPFPSDSLINQQTGLVSLPIAAGDPMAPIKQQLNQLAGFTTTGSASFPVDTVTNPGKTVPVAIDQATVTAESAILLPLLGGSPPLYTPVASILPVGSTSAPTGYAVQVQMSPTTALLDSTRYLGLVTTNIKDQNGVSLTRSPLTVLLTQSGPLTTSSWNRCGRRWRSFSPSFRPPA
jgi:hypothetical protein